MTNNTSWMVDEYGEPRTIEIGHIVRVMCDSVVLEDGRMFRRWMSGNWQANVWSEGAGWYWTHLSTTDSFTLALEELYQGYEPKEREEDNQG